jgi:hypothetical protein
MDNQDYGIEDAFVTTEDRCSHCGSKLANAETARLTYQGEAHKLGEELERTKVDCDNIIDRLKKERDGLRFSLNTCVGAAGIGDADELCGWIDRVKAKLTKAEQSVSTLLCAINQKDKELADYAKDFAKAEACCGEMRSALVRASDYLDGDVPHLPQTCGILGQPLCYIHHALALDCGTGYLSPQQVREAIGADTEWPLVDIIEQLWLASENLESCDWARKHAVRYAKALETLTKGERQERCSKCGVMTYDWVDPDEAHGRVCRKCEAALTKGSQ